MKSWKHDPLKGLCNPHAHLNFLELSEIKNFFLFMLATFQVLNSHL